MPKYTAKHASKGSLSPEFSAVDISGLLLAAGLAIVNDCARNANEQRRDLALLLALADSFVPILQARGVLFGGSRGRRLWARLHGLETLLHELDTQHGPTGGESDVA